ncbi:MAG: TRAP transporter large permease [Pseudotabrizicola sp.]|uniref:TRAP transporter large permease n=1 Tax=Pseudotabrizicola sp. TaxID=2939647 RepID=UPI002731B3FC|nr:TRAP transporter large permease [Pseudotabrizicola sp.]MDP2079383.1 TRAP transporter large permease [Pseudotabrizicola sp.]MDZ7573601.1 TRAP transporter large permease [Pseudotabrizicola sp.]
MIVGSLSMAAAILLAFFRVPLALALLAVSAAGIGFAINWNVAFQLLPLTISEAVLSYDLAVVPMFILMGNVISKTGIAHDLFRAAYAFVGNVRGGLALSTMTACAGFSAVCGSSYATAATMAKVAYPSMKKYNYSDELAAGTIAAGGTLGILIPPSIIMVVYGILTQTNIGDMFIAGVVPGVMGLAMYMLVIRLVAALNPDHAPKGEKTPWPEKMKALSGVWPFLLLFGLIIGGLYGKLFTPTEAAGMGAGLAIVIATLHGRMSWAMLRAVVVDTAYTSVSLYTVLFGALMLSKLLTLSGLAAGVLALVQSTGLEGIALILVIMLVFLVFGCVMDSMAIILIFVPLFAPIVVAQGFDLVWFGILVIVATEIALITPPVGMNVFVLKAVLPGVPVVRIFKGLVPFVAVDVVRLGILIAFPAVALWLGSTG